VTFERESAEEEIIQVTPMLGVTNLVTVVIRSATQRSDDEELSKTET
jgi:hypothetical protein